MNKKVYNLVVAISGAIATIAIALVTYFQPQYATAINSSIEIAETAFVTICNKFVNTGLEKK